MSRQFILSLIALLLFSTLYSQDSNEIKNELSSNDPQIVHLGIEHYLKTNPKDSKFIDTLIWVSNNYYALNYSRADQLKIGLEIPNTIEIEAKKLFGTNNSKYAEALHQIAKYHMNSKEAVNYNLQALSIRESLDNKPSVDIARSLVNLSINYIELDDMEKFEEYSLKAIQFITSLKIDKIWVQTPFTNLARFYSFSNDLKAISVLTQLFELQIELNQTEGLFWTSAYIGELYQDENPDSSITYMTRSLEYGQSVFKTDTLRFYSPYRGLALSHWKLGNHALANKHMEIYQRFVIQNDTSKYIKSMVDEIHHEIIYSDEINLNKKIKKAKNWFKQNYDKDNRRLSDFYTELALLLFKSNYELLAEEVEQKAFKSLIKANAPRIDIFKAKGRIITSIMNNGDNKKAITLFVKLLDEFDEPEIIETSIHSIFLHNLALCYANILDYNSAIKNAEQFLINADKYKYDQLFDSYNKILDRLNIFYEQTYSYEKAANHLEKSSAYYKQIGENYKYIKSLLHLSNTQFSYLGNIDDANAILEYCSDYCEQSFPEKHIIFAHLSLTKANFYRLQSKYTGDFLNFYKKAQEIFELNNSTDDIAYWECLSWIASHELITGNKLSGLQLSEKRYNLIEKAYGEKNLFTLKARSQLISSLDYFVSLDSIQTLYKNLLVDISNSHGESNSTYLKVLIEYADNYPKEEWLKARVVYEKYIVIADSLNVGLRLRIRGRMGLADTYSTEGKESKWENCWDTIFTLIKTANISSEDFYNSYRVNYAVPLVRSQKKCDKGLRILIDEQKLIDKKSYRHFSVIISGLLYCERYEEAFDAITEGLDHLKNTYGEVSNEYIELLGQLIQYYKKKNEPGKVIQYNELRYRLVKELNPMDLQKQWDYSRNLAQAYHELNSNRGVTIINDMLSQFSTQDVDSINQPLKDLFIELKLFKLLGATITSNLFYNNSFKEEYTDFLENFKNEVGILKKHSSPELAVMGQVLLIQMRILGNDPSLNDEVVLETIVKAEPLNQSSYVREFLGYFYHYIGNDSVALTHAHFTNDLSLLEIIYRTTNDYKSADSINYLNAKKAQLNLMTNYSYLSSKQQNTLKYQSSKKLKWSMKELLLEGKNEGISNGQIFDLVLNSYGLISSSKKELIKHMREGNEDYVKSYNKWEYYNTKIIEESNKLKSAEKTKITDSILILEHYLYQNVTANKEVKWQSWVDLQSKLKPNEAFIQTYRLETQNDSVSYCFFIIQPNKEDVEIVILDNGILLEHELLSHYTSQTIHSIEVDWLSFEYYWGALQEKLSDIEHIYFVPDGVYYNVNLNALYNRITEKYLLDELDLTYLSNSLSFTEKTNDEKEYSNTTATLIGFPDFNGNTSENITNSNLIVSRDLGDGLFTSINRGGLVSPLPGTLIEIDTLTKQLNSNGWNVIAYTGNQANESAVKNIKDSKIVHIATHGYFFENSSNNLSDFGKLTGIEQDILESEPLLRSGLLLAGAKNTLLGKNKGTEDGILSAYEASFMNLSETELVVLSACETGRGEIQNSEGVYGLRKAMSDAGAANTIMSLWKVDDNVTQEFMTTFYSTWLSGKTIREAFRETQLTIKEKYPRPYYWGAFVLVGE